MTTEENNRMLALSYIVADLKTENMELEQRVHQLEDDNNEVVHQLNDKDEYSSKRTIAEMQQMREQCEYLEKKNEELERFAKAMNEFVTDKNLYMRKDNECPYRSGDIPVYSTSCLECDSCLGIIEGHGVICEKRLTGASVATQADKQHRKECPHHSNNS